VEVRTHRPALAPAHGRAARGQGLALLRSEAREPVVDLVARKCVPGFGPARNHLRGAGELPGFEEGGRGQQAQAGEGLGTAFRARGVMQFLAQHLVAAADPQEPGASFGGFPQGFGHARSGEMHQIAHGGLGARQHQQVQIPGQGGIRHPGEVQVRLRQERRQVLGVAHPGVEQGAHSELARRRPLIHGDAEGAVLLIQLVLQMGHQGQHRQAGALLQQSDAVLEERGIAPEAVHHDSQHPGAVLGGQQVQRADHLGEHAAPVDVRHQHEGGVRVAGGGQVHEVPGHEVELHGAASAFHHDDLVLGPEPVQGGQGHGPVGIAIPEVVLGLLHPQGLAQHHHLGAGLAQGLEQHGAHVHVGRPAAGCGLEDLGPGHLQALGRHARLVGHVLGLEGRHIEARIRQQAAEPCGDEALADIRCRSENGEGPCHPSTSASRVREPGPSKAPGRTRALCSALNLVRTSGACPPGSCGEWRSPRAAGRC